MVSMQRSSGRGLAQGRTRLPMRITLARFQRCGKLTTSHRLFSCALPIPLASDSSVPIIVSMPHSELTDEQNAVVASNARRLAVVAGAGTGKTHTLAALAARRPGERILYATFSKAAQTDASHRLPPNVQARTLSSLAFPTHGRRFRNSGKLFSTVRAASVAALFAGPDPQLSLLRARFAIDSVHRFCQSTHQQPSPPADLVSAAARAGVSQASLEADTHTLWARMSDCSDRSVPATHDAYFKAWALDGAPGLERLADRFLVDEAQDNSPVADSLFATLSKPVVYVGDPSQSIYAFRGAVDTLSSFDADEMLSLSVSFRFGPNVASLANALLAHFKTSPLRMTGAALVDAIAEVQADLPFAVVTRTNAGVFSHAVTALDAGYRIELVGGPESYAFARLIDLFNLERRKDRIVLDPLLKALGSLDAALSYAKLTGDHELKAAIRVVRQYGDDLPHLVARIKASATRLPLGDSRPLVTLCTTHRAKGLEFGQVAMGADFPSIYLPDGNLVPAARADQQEVNLLYVALTRACAVLCPTPSLRRLFDAYLAASAKFAQPLAATQSSHRAGSNRLSTANTLV